MPLAIAGLLAGCSGNPDRYPSLAVRDAERYSGTLNPVSAPTTPPVAPVADRATLAGLVDSAEAAHRDFLLALPNAKQSAERAQGLDVESNAWSAAQIALADLDAHRSTALLALGDIDLLAAEAATSFAPTADIAAAQDKVRAIVDEQAATYLSLTEGIAR